MAVHRGKQKRTMADVRSVAVAVESYAVDNDVFPIQATQGPLAGVDGLLAPTYSKSLQHLDGWGRDLRYASDGVEYTLASLGKDGIASGPASGPTTDFDDDLIFAMGAFIAWPEGAQD